MISAARLFRHCARIAPGAAMLARYRREDLPHDLRAGLSVAAVAVPVGVAYAELAGFNPVIGLYSSILPLVAYALFGSSRQLIVGPDAATCALVAAAVAPLAARNPALYGALSITLAFIAGTLLVGASFLKLGALADFLSRPILIGFMNGVALSIILGQLGKLCGFDVESGGIVPRLIEVAGKLDHVHWPTLGVATGAFVILWASPRLLPRVPAGLLVIVVAAAAVAGLDLDRLGVATVGALPAGLPMPQLPDITFRMLKSLLADAAGIALIAFTSHMLTVRSFAAKNGYEVDADREMAALGAANLATAVSGGFAVSGADSRTAVNDAAGGRTQAAGLIAAAVIAVVMLVLTGPLKYLPQAALGAVLVMAAWSLIDVRGMQALWREDRQELAICGATMLGVIAVGVIDAILFAVVLTLLRFLRIVARPPCEILGEVAGRPGFHSVERHPGAQTVPGLCLFRFNSPIVFFNAPYFKREVQKAVASAGPQLRWLVLDAVPVTSHDATGRFTLREVERELAARGIGLAIAGRETEIIEWRRERELDVSSPTSVRVFPTLRRAVKALRRELEPDMPLAD